MIQKRVIEMKLDDIKEMETKKIDDTDEKDYLRKLKMRY